MSSKVHSHHPAVDPAAYDSLQRKTFTSNIAQQKCSFMNIPHCYRASVILIMLTVNTAQESAEWPPPWSRSSTGPFKEIYTRAVKECNCFSILLKAGSVSVRDSYDFDTCTDASQA
uniref:Uncharacterized protein n=1 Tax=Seriola dumerili TaxID=41447 RepID=A0A3B4UM66_SERDU